MPRDDFSAKVIERLRNRVAHRCSNPDCRVPTVGPGVDSMAVANIGKAAHIAAASAGGPRYVAAMSSVERSSIDNALWLCSNCATKIDVAPDFYPIGLLHEWKRSAEAAADAEKGKPLPGHDDARNQLVAALSGTAVPFMTTTIHNVHGAVEQSLEALDPRFRIETSFSKNKSIYSIHARESVDCKLQIPVELAGQWNTAFRNLIDHGHDVKLPAAGVQLKGSPLLDKLFSNAGLANAELRIESRKIPAIQKLKLIERSTNLVEQFDDIVGEISLGRESFRFEGKACGEAFEMSFEGQRSGDEKGVTVSTHVRFDRWSDLDVRAIPYFEKLLRLSQRLTSGWCIDSELEIDGVQVTRLSGGGLSESHGYGWLSGVLQYIANVRKITDFTGTAVKFKSDIEISADAFQEAAEVVEIIDGKVNHGRSDLKSNLICKFVAENNGPNIKTILDLRESTSIRLVQQEGCELVAFGQVIRLPRLVVNVAGALPMMVNTSLESIKDGDVVEIEWEPSDGFQYSLQYVRDTEEQER